jgi:hypothetical protein
MACAPERLRWSIRERLIKDYLRFFGAFGVACDDAMVAGWSANPLRMLWPGMDAKFVTSGGRKRWPADSSVPAGGGHCRELALEWAFDERELTCSALEKYSITKLLSLLNI